MSEPFVVNAVYRAKEGEADAVADALLAMAPHARSEPGCRDYQVHRSADDAHGFLLYERYDSPEAFERHKDSDAFDRHIRNQAWPLLAERSATFWRPLDD